MQLVKSTTHERTSKLGAIRLAISALVILIINPANAQDNSPYSRYGLGDLHPTTHIFNRGMAGVSQADIAKRITPNLLVLLCVVDFTNCIQSFKD